MEHEPTNDGFVYYNNKTYVSKMKLKSAKTI